ncbi:hypothetical protein F9L07_19870 [Pimelobacter simplex]|uniref:Uncharacterized protein n=1 Tax=Nocardioides simplex TaxID=2045 RepID=A0A7J5DVS8_NOCSI|nr:hypothetical protein [Pimelobacter simplex]KAB2809300.1 hypothetical protein F9L07_19870 [Pimelobacter simplex]
MSGVQPVFPASGGTGGSSPAAGAGGGKGIRIGKMRLGQREAMIGGAAIVGALALFARSRAGGDTTAEGDDVTSEAGAPGAYEIDTRSTDFYNELQPELEAINDGLEDLAGAVKQIPRTPTPAPKPPAPKPKPKMKKKPKGKPKSNKKPKKKPPRKPPRKPRKPRFKKP